MSRPLNGITNLSITELKCDRKLEIGGLLVCIKTTAKCSASSNATITVKSTLVEVDTLAGGGASSISNIFVDKSLGDTAPDGTIVRLTGKTGVTEIRCNASGNLQMNGVATVDIKPTNFINFLWVSAQGKWIWCSGND
jgi:hypothetical protein